MAWLRRLFQPLPSTSELAGFFNEAAQDEEHYPSTIDPRIYHVKLLQEHLGSFTTSA